MGSSQDDNALAILAGKGDRDAFRQLLERHYDMIYRVALRFCTHVQEAEDIAQDVCVSLASAIKQFDGRSAFTTWLYRVVMNRAKDAHRRKVTAVRVTSDYAEVEDLRRGEAQEQQRQSEWLAEMMAQLPSDLQEVAILVVGEGMNHADAADVLGIKEGTVSWRMSELKKALRNLAKEDA